VEWVKEFGQDRPKEMKNVRKTKFKRLGWIVWCLLLYPRTNLSVFEFAIELSATYLI